MKKKIHLVFAKLPLIAVCAVLLSALFLNLSTLWSVGRIQRGGLVTSGYFCAIIGSGSMEPSLSVNDLLLIKGTRSYQATDIVTYISPRGALITHRIKEVSPQGYIVQGDANNVPDEELLRQRILGKVIFVLPGAGGIVERVFSPAGMLLLAAVFLLVYLIQRIRRD